MIGIRAAGLGQPQGFDRSVGVAPRMAQQGQAHQGALILRERPGQFPIGDLSGCATAPALLQIGQQQPHSQRGGFGLRSNQPAVERLELGLGEAGLVLLQPQQGEQLQGLHLIVLAVEDLAQLPLGTAAVALITPELGEHQPQRPAIGLLVGHGLQNRDRLTLALQAHQQLQQALTVGITGLAATELAAQPRQLVDQRDAAHILGGSSHLVPAQPPAAAERRGTEQHGAGDGPGKAGAAARGGGHPERDHAAAGLAEEIETALLRRLPAALATLARARFRPLRASAPTTMRQHPISPVTEPMQYRAIGLVRGVYVPSDPDQLTRGVIRTDDGTELEAVVLGRLLTLIRRHLDLAEPHLWVVYPRSRDETQLHLQMVGVWEPSTLAAGQDDDTPTEGEAPSDALEEGDGWFSVRGELIYTRPETGDLVVKVRQKPRADGNRPIPFKLQLRGAVPLEHLRHFVSLDLRLLGQQLNVEKLEVIGPVAQRGTRGGKTRRGAGAERSEGERRSVDAGADRPAAAPRRSHGRAVSRPAR